MKSKKFTCLVVFFMCVTYTSVIAQTSLIRNLMGFLMTEGDDLHLEDSTYLFVEEVFVEEVINNTKPYGIYLFGLNGSHQDKFFYLNYSDSISIVKTLRLEDILISVSLYFRLNPDISFEEKIKYYSSIIKIINESSRYPWEIKNDNYISNGPGILDTISQKDLIVSGLLVGSKKNTLLASLGKPDSIISHINEFEDTEGSKYFYKKSTFIVEDGKFTSFNLKDNNFRLDHGEIRVGDPLRKIEYYFPNSYENKEVKDINTTIRIKIGKTDSYLLFICLNEKVHSIMTWDDL